eukprot:1438028-Rhodomonas_salina.1
MARWDVRYWGSVWCYGASYYARAILNRYARAVLSKSTVPILLRMRGTNLLAIPLTTRRARY